VDARLETIDAGHFGPITNHRAVVEIIGDAVNATS